MTPLCLDTTRTYMQQDMTTGSCDSFVFHHQEGRFRFACILPKSLPARHIPVTPREDYVVFSSPHSILYGLGTTRESVVALALFTGTTFLHNTRDCTFFSYWVSVSLGDVSACCSWGASPSSFTIFCSAAFTECAMRTSSSMAHAPQDMLQALLVGGIPQFRKKIPSHPSIGDAFLAATT